MRSFTFVMVALFCSSAIYAQSVRLDVNQLQREIDAAGADWQAEDSGFEVPMYEGERGASVFGLIPDPKSISLDAKSGWKPRPRKRLAPKLDWRSHNGHNWLPPIRNQGQCGSCTAFAAIALMETQLNIASQTPGMNIDLSEQYLFSRIGRCSSGSMPGNAMSQMRYTGVPDEQCQPYVSGRMGADQSSGSACSDRSQRSYQLNSFQSVAPYNLKWALQYGPVLTTMSVYEDFKYYKSGVYKHVTGKLLGGHAVLLVGYDDAEQAWIVRNSWGEKWGEQGYFRISYKANSSFGLSNHRGTTTQVRRFAKLNTPATVGASTSSVDFKVERYAATANTNATFAALLSNSSNQFQIRFPDGQYAVNADLTPLADGNYTIRLRNMTSASKDSFSNITVAMNNPNIKPHIESEFDASVPVSGKVKFFVTASLNSVYPTSSLISFIDKDDKVISTYEIPNPGEKAKFSWYTEKVENGEYRVKATHRVGEEFSFDSDEFAFTVEN